MCPPWTWEGGEGSQAIALYDPVVTPRSLQAVSKGGWWPSQFLTLLTFSPRRPPAACQTPQHVEVKPMSLYQLGRVHRVDFYCGLWCYDFKIMFLYLPTSY